MYYRNTANSTLTVFLHVKLTFPKAFSRCCSPFDVSQNASSYLHLRFAENRLRELAVILKRQCSLAIILIGGVGGCSLFSCTSVFHKEPPHYSSDVDSTYAEEVNNWLYS